MGYHPFQHSHFLTKHRRATVRSRRWDTIPSNTRAVNPLGVAPSSTLRKHRKVARAIIGREQLHNATVGVLDLGSLGGLETDAVAFSGNRDFDGLAGVVGHDELPVAEGEGAVEGGQGQEEEGGLVHFW